MINTSVHNCATVELRSTVDIGSSLVIVENGINIPFDVKRIYYLYNVPGDQVRGGHAHKRLRQLIVAACGSFEVILDDGKAKRTISLSGPKQGLLIVPGIWRELEHFSPDAVCLVLASLEYDEQDYIRDYESFLIQKAGDIA
ncbi:MAG: hypothetical protein A2087_06695 [Spirochaetes bacterium GWD1_61_31]|nr:MAG: hypothetical protein A2Y37_08775 [Spirochaetes bacterium GWB1_60_80]OHD31865.1 MAG: hypothetical protein A2004_10160 [Spirochaetes bacterium GWC1_61_12]OHD40038.1 MAG: hypothetical protein A2087_06695 [Spirochaetes bacterium GWD1_61_31]OHD42308.1 MAG: hypothetical protein A2Y35_11305 [Spirochaetes bacterium GWE1_60_18]OHD58456.1 MAG: hypothetical protein A2Y32_06800 [Spirochaetes bacterium GWF1_60_12]HAW85443.1 hypothetical protein [Spirochaetaceae bacterium]